MKKIDMTGRTYNRWTILSESTTKIGFWLCKCTCGRKKEVSGSSIRQDISTGCRKCSTNKNDLLGQTFGKWKVTSEVKERRAGGGIAWLCECICGRQVEVSGGLLVNGESTQCKHCRTTSVNLSKSACILKSNKNLSYEFLSKVNPEVISALTGTILGDSSIRMRATGASLTFNHAYSFKDYAISKKEYFIEQIPSLTINSAKTYTTSKNKVYELYTSWSHNHPIFIYFRNLFYPNGTKIISEEILNLLTPRGLAYWHMDDGCLVDNSISIATYCFSELENIMISGWFYKKLNIKSKVVLDVNDKEELQYFLKFNVDNTFKFIDIIKDYVFDIMKYKIISNKPRRRIKHGVK